jgi:hypothetical protein
MIMTTMASIREALLLFYFLTRIVTVIMTIIFLKIKFQNYDCDIDNTVYKQLCNRQHKHIVDHIWAAVYLEEEENS